LINLFVQSFTMATGNLIDFDDAEPVAQSYPWTQPSGEALQAPDSFDDLPPYQGPGYAKCAVSFVELLKP
jgi:hypothetical protein